MATAACRIASRCSSGELDEPPEYPARYWNDLLVLDQGRGDQSCGAFLIGFAFLTLLPHVPGMLRQPTLSAGFIAPCLHTKAHTLPSGSLWLHEIEHDGPGHRPQRRRPCSALQQPSWQ